MKTKISRIGKKSLSVIIALMMIVSTMLVGMVSASAASETFVANSTIYIDIGTTWYGSVSDVNATIYANYCYSNGDSDINNPVYTEELTHVSGSIYTGTIPENAFIRCIKVDRRNSNGTTTWNSFKVLASSRSNDSNNLATFTQSGEDWSNGSVAWSNYSGGSGETTTNYFYSYWNGQKSVYVPMVYDSDKSLYKVPTNSTLLMDNKKFKINTSNADGTADDKTNGACLNWRNPKPTLTKSANSGATVGYNDEYGNCCITSDTTDFIVTYDPNATSSSANGEIKVWSVADYNGTTEPTTTEPVETTVPPTTAPVTTPGAYTITDATTDLNGSLSFSASGGTTAGTANSGDTVTITVNPVKSYFELDTVTVTGADNLSIPVSGTGDTRTFTMPAQNVTAKATFKLNKSAYIQSLNEDGLWIDVAPDTYDTTATLIKWNNYTGSNHGTNDYYTFYVPKNVVLSNAHIYNGFNNVVKLNGTEIPSKGSAVVNLSAGSTYSSGNDNSYTVKVMQGSTNAMFLYTTNTDGTDKDLPTKIDGSLTTKDTVKATGGLCTTMVNSGTNSTISSAMKLESVKGRGNSSWEASYKFFGKYAFNMKLGSKTKLFGMDSAKSWCLLANNADESMLRNALTYQLAAEIGIQDSPEFRFVDIYDNGEYLGSYLVTEKVDVGKNKLVKGESFEDLNEKGAEADGATEVKEDTVKSTYSYGSSTYSMQYAKVSPNGVTSDSAKYPSETKGKYLLEFEIRKRLFPSDGNENNKSSEASWFKSPKGQYVVVKSPEFATKEQVTYIAQKFATMEAMIFTSGATKAQLSTVMDVESFAKMYLIQEFTANLDAASTSYYITFDCSQTNPVFVANPVWDYDMALGQFEKTNYKFAVGEQSLSPAKTDAWLAKYKRMDDSEHDAPDKYSIQSQLASQNSAFKTEIRKQWEGTNGFYAKIQKYIGENGQIKKTWFDNINASAEMNEARWGFIRNDLLSEAKAKWGVKDTGANHTAAVNYLNKWVTDRASWLNGEFTKDSEYAPYTPSKPTIAAYNSDLTATISQVDYGASFVIKVTPPIESNVTYRLYEGSSSAYLYENSDGVFNVNATEAGIKSYTVKAVYGSTESEASSAVSVTVIAPADLEGVSLSVSNTSVNVNEEFTLTAKAAPVGVTGVKYTFYKDNVAIASDITSNTYTTKLTVQGTADYKVKATANGISFESSVVTVTAAKVAQVHDFRVYFKCASAPAYKPYVSLDGAKAVKMTQGTELGKNYAGTLTFFWYYADFSNVDSADTHTLTFTSKRTKLNATITNNFANSEYYLAVDNLMTGTEVVDLTGSLVYVRNFFHSATNLVYSGVGTDKTLGFTNIDGEMYKMGTVVNTDGTLTFSVKSATTMQMLTAELTTVSETQQAILDVNLDGKVDIKDATLMQRALAS